MSMFRNKFTSMSGTFTSLLLSLLFFTFAKANVERGITIMNESGSKIAIEWLSPDGDETVPQGEVLNGASLTLNSFVSHEFEVRELPSKKTGVCKGDTCGVGHFQVSKNRDQVVFVKPGNPGLDVTFEDDKLKAQGSASEILTECQRRAVEAIGSTAASAQSAIEGLAKCVKKSIATELAKSKEEISFQANVRMYMARLLENYTCADFELNTTGSESDTAWFFEGVKREVNIMLDRPASKVHVVKNFISEDECAAMEAAAAPLLNRATVADGSGGSEVSKNRKAMQAGITVPWDKERQGDPIARLSRRVYDYVNHVLDLNIDEHGQEGLMSIQYFGRGEDDEEPDRYMPHCDGDCSGLKFKPGNRMATMVMYCTVPEKGGATNFRNSGLHIVPEKGSATFFSYIDPETQMMDNGFTEHSGCPVIEGEKKIVTQWVRLGVTKEVPWDQYNTLGVLDSSED